MLNSSSIRVGYLNQPPFLNSCLTYGCSRAGINGDVFLKMMKLANIDNMTFVEYRYTWQKKDYRSTYIVSYRECGQFRPYVHENFEKFEMISTSTGSWIRLRLRHDRMRLAPPARSNPTARRRRNHLEFFKIFMSIGTENCPHSRWDTNVKTWFFPETMESSWMTLKTNCSTHRRRRFGSIHN